MKQLLPLMLGLALFATQQAWAQTTLDPDFGVTSMPLYDGAQAGNGATLTIFTPATGRANGTSVIIAPGGAYIHLSMNLEGRQMADWFTARGVTAFVLRYRLGPAVVYPAPLEDAQRAVRLVRSMAQKYKLDPARVGFAGFSAGGHLAAMVGTLNDAGDASATDPVARLSSRPDFLVLAYAWLNAMQPQVEVKGTKLINYCSVMKVLPEARCKELETAYTPALRVTAQTPPAFLYATTDDHTVPVSASVDFYNAMVAAGADAELHVFRHGAHGSGLGMASAALDVWPALLEQWMRDENLLNAPAPPQRP